LFLSSVTQAQETKTVTTVNNKKGQNTIITILLPNFYTKTAQNPDQQAEPGAKYCRTADY
jgi:hypothetical protein